MFSHSYLGAYGENISGDGSTDLEAQFGKALGRLPTESEIPAAIKAWDSMSYDQFGAWVKQTFPTVAPSSAPSTAALVGALGELTGGMSLTYDGGSRVYDAPFLGSSSGSSSGPSPAVALLVVAGALLLL